MIWIILKWLLIAIAGYAAGHFEVERLVVSTEPEDKRWDRSVLSKRFKIWKTDQSHWFKKLTDSYHLFHTIMIYCFIVEMFFSWTIIELLIASELFWWVRNMEMLIVALKSPRWWYIVPRFGGILESKWR